MYKTNVFIENNGSNIKVDVFDKEQKKKILENALSVFYKKDVKIKYVK